MTWEHTRSGVTALMVTCVSPSSPPPPPVPATGAVATVIVDVYVEFPEDGEENETCSAGPVPCECARVLGELPLTCTRIVALPPWESSIAPEPLVGGFVDTSRST